MQILTNRVSQSSAKSPGQELTFVDDLDVTSDGTVYFSTLHDVPIIKDKTGEYEALQPAVLNIFQASVFAPKTAVVHPASETVSAFHTQQE